MEQLTEQRSLGELFSELAQETTILVRKEVELGKAEMTAKAKVAGRDVAVVGGGAAIALLGAMALVAALILVLGTVMPLWGSAFLVGVVVSIVGDVLVVKGIRALKGFDPAPRQTIQTLQEDKRWLKEQVSR